jgi:hypothetical protein
LAAVSPAAGAGVAAFATLVGFLALCATFLAFGASVDGVVALAAVVLAAAGVVAAGVVAAGVAAFGTAAKAALAKRDATRADTSLFMVS